MKSLTEKVVLVTGASAGIGAAMVRALAQAGAHVLLVARGAEKLAALVDELAHHPGRRVALAGDLRELAFCQQAVSATVAEFGRIDILINNAGLGHRSPISSIPADHMHTIVDTNILAPLHLSQAAVPFMRAQGGGHIINVSSIISQRPLANSGFYCASKTALNFISRSLRMELRRDNIAISILYPGMTDTDFHEAILGGGRKRRWGGISAERVALATVKAIHTQRSEVYVTTLDWLFTHLNRLMPRLTDRLAALAWRG